MRDLDNMSGIMKQGVLKLIPHILFLLFFASISNGQPKSDEVLLTVHDRVITRDEFLYHFKKNYQDINRNNIAEYLDLFVNFQLKLAEAREDQVHKSIGFINELAEFRLILAAPLLTDHEKEKELTREASERLNYEVHANHLLIRIEPDSDPADTLKAFAKAVLLRNRILHGESFWQVANSVTDDKMITINPGYQGYFTAFQSPYPFETTVFNMNPGEVSMPVRSLHGYHIIQLINKRENTGEPKTEDEILTLIKGAKDERFQMIEDAFVEKLKSYWNFKENPDALNIFYELVDNRVFKGTWEAPANKIFNDTLFSIDGKGVSQNEFIEFMRNNEVVKHNLTLRNYVSSLYKKFVSQRLIQYENYKLPDKYPEFRFQYEEYRDAMLLLQITKQNVWLKAESDKEGMEKFFMENKKEYIREKGNKSLNDVYDIVKADYQNYLMKEWIRELRKKYKVQINEEVLSTIK